MSKSDQNPNSAVNKHNTPSIRDPLEEKITPGNRVWWSCSKWVRRISVAHWWWIGRTTRRILPGWVTGDAAAGANYNPFHFCIQGWSDVAKWTGMPMRHILDLVRPMPKARYAVFYSLTEGAHGGVYYDCHKMENMQHELTILALDMNDDPLSVLHGAPLRLRCENELGFKMVKWITAI